MIISKNVIHELAIDIQKVTTELITGGFFGGEISKRLFNTVVSFDLNNAVIALEFASDSMNNLTTVEAIENLIHLNNQYARENSERHYEQQERFYTSGEAFEREA